MSCRKWNQGKENLRSIATSGVAARKARIQRALAQALILDPGQCRFVGPSAEYGPEGFLVRERSNVVFGDARSL